MLFFMTDVVNVIYVWVVRIKGSSNENFIVNLNKIFSALASMREDARRKFLYTLSGKVQGHCDGCKEGVERDLNDLKTE